MRMATMVTMIGTLAAGAAQGQTATVLDAAQLDGLLTGNTVYIAIPPGGPGGPSGGMAPFVYGGDGRAVAALPNGVTLRGRWRIEGDHYCVDWSNGPKNSCSRLIKQGGEIRMVDVATDDPRGAIDHIRPGNPEEI